MGTPFSWPEITPEGEATRPPDRVTKRCAPKLSALVALAAYTYDRRPKVDPPPEGSPAYWTLLYTRGALRLVC